MQEVTFSDSAIKICHHKAADCTQNTNKSVTCESVFMCSIIWHYPAIKSADCPKRCCSEWRVRCCQKCKFKITSQKYLHFVHHSSTPPPPPPPPPPQQQQQQHNNMEIMTVIPSRGDKFYNFSFKALTGTKTTSPLATATSRLQILSSFSNTVTNSSIKVIIFV